MAVRRRLTGPLRCQADRGASAKFHDRIDKPVTIYVAQSNAGLSSALPRDILGCAAGRLLHFALAIGARRHSGQEDWPGLLDAPAPPAIITVAKDDAPQSSSQSQSVTMCWRGPSL